MPSKSKKASGGVFGFVRNLSRDAGEASTASIEGLLAPAEFEQELVKERCRVDRGGPPFALLAIDLKLDRESEAFAQAAWVLAAVLNERTRVIDSKGWFRGRIGVILPGATSEHIPKICAQFETAFKRRSRARTVPGKEGSAALEYEVFVYPNDGKHSVLHEAQASR